MNAINKYLDYLVQMIIEDMGGYTHWSMYLVIPAVLYTCFLMLKYLIFTLPMWFPFVAIINAIRRPKIVQQIITKPKEKE